MDNTNKGTLNINDKQGNDKRPDMKGRINVDGKEYWLSAWEREGKNGKFWSLSIEAKKEAQEAYTKATGQDIPF